MSNPFVDYYTNQAGSGLAHFEGYKYQRGHGFFGNLFKNILRPLGLYLGKQALSAGVNIGKDVLSGQNFKDSLKNNAKNTAKSILIDSAEKVGQLRNGKRRIKKKRPTKKTTVKRKTSKKIVNKFSLILSQ